jgi:hypothetical protein
MIPIITMPYFNRTIIRDSGWYLTANIRPITPGGVPLR